jgi:hypothetical protein
VLFSGFVLLHNFDMVLVRVPFDMSQVATITDSNIDKNHSVIMKIDKLVWSGFFGSLKSGWLQFEKFKNCEILEK